MKSKREKELDNLKKTVHRNKLKDSDAVSVNEMVETLISKNINISQQHAFIFEKD